MEQSWKELVAMIGIVLIVDLLHVEATFIVEKNSLNVTSPASLKGTYNSAIGNFGIPLYGGSIVGSVSYPNNTSNACTAFDHSFKSTKSGSLSPILLVDRGGCFFALKVWNAQNAGAAAVLVSDDREEALITMDSPEEDKNGTYTENITIPSALIEKTLGDAIKNALRSGNMVNINLDWRESLPHPDDRVEYEFWTNSNNICGPKCDIQIDFLKNFKGAGQILERGGYSQFTPHYITWYCPEIFIFTKQCRSQCINEGRYCAPDPEQDFRQGYDGKDVVTENLRHLCLFKVANDLKKPWVWWDYATDFQIRCPMREKKYNKECAEQVINSLGLPLDKIQNCMGDPNVDAENPVLRKEQEAQMGHDSRGDVTILPTLIINNRQYRGKLDKGAVLKAICAGFKETTEPTVCLSEAVETNECLSNNGGCWQDSKANVTACKDTFRGRICECPLVQGVQYQGDGYNHCEVAGPGRCKVGNGGCWQNTKEGNTYSACSDAQQKGCQCPFGFSGNGVDNCEDIDECKEKVACQCPDCRCKNTYGSYNCECQGDLLYIKEHDTCIGKMYASSSTVGGHVAFVILAGFAIAGLAVYVLYKYRLRSYMDSEIRAIMAQYMPLDNQNDVHQHLQEDF